MTKLIYPYASFVCAFFLLSGCTKTTNNYLPGLVQTNPNDRSETSPGTSEAQGGVINGGGGRGVKCTKNGVQTVQILDLYEAKALYNLQPVDLGDTKDKSAEAVSQIVATHFWNPLSSPIKESVDRFKTEMIQTYLDRIHFIQAGQHLKLTDDAHAPILEAGCEDVQIATYYDESILIVDNELWSQLDWTNRMGLLAHELLYQYARQFGSTNSMSTRKLVGMLLSTKHPRPIAEAVPTDEDAFAHCSLKQNGLWKGHFFLFESLNNRQRQGMEFVFAELPEGSMFFRTSAFLENMNFARLLLPRGSDRGQSRIETDTYPGQDQILVNFDGTTGDDLKGKILIQSTNTAQRSVNYDVNCIIPRDRSKIITHLNRSPEKYR